MTNKYILQTFMLLIVISLTMTSCSSEDPSLVSSNSASQGQGNQTAGSNGNGNGNSGDWNQTAGGNGGYNSGGDIPTVTPTPTSNSNNGNSGNGNGNSGNGNGNSGNGNGNSGNGNGNSGNGNGNSGNGNGNSGNGNGNSGNGGNNGGVTQVPTPTVTVDTGNGSTNGGNNGGGVTPTPTNTCTIGPTVTSTAVSGVPGCMVSHAINFNPQATQDNGTCTFSACLDANFEEYSGENIVNEIQSYLSAFQLEAADVVQSTCQTFKTQTTSNFCCGCFNPVVTEGMLCPGNCSQKFTSNPSCYWSYLSCSQNRILQAYHSNGSLKFKTYQPVPYCYSSTPTKAAFYQHKFGVDYEVALHVKKLARPIAYAPLKLHPSDPRLKGQTYLSFKNTIGLMVNADFSMKQFIHGQANNFTPSASCTATYEVRGNYVLNTTTGLLELQTPGQNITTVDRENIVVATAFTQSPFWIRLKKQGNVVSCYYQAGNTYPASWSMMSAAPQIIHGWDGQTVLNAIIGPQFEAGIILNTHSLEGIEVYEYKQISP